MFMLTSYFDWKKKINETGAGVGVPFVGQAASPGGEMSWQGAPGGGMLHSAKGNPITHKKRKRKKHK